MANRNLNKARNAKNDEFYTLLEDIEAEVYHYWRHFKNKVVYLNCDDPLESKFWDYFAKQFENLKLKKLIATSYIGGLTGRAMKFVYEGDRNGNGLPDPDEIEATPLDGDGDFRSPECVELLQEADIVVTNPPFSLFREYIAQLMQYRKKFLVIGNVNAITYREIFPLIRNNKVWLGPSISSGDRKFYVPDHYPLRASGCGIENGRKWIRVKGVRWFTNMSHKKRNRPLDLVALYDSDKYPKYDNYDAIEVSRVAQIPEDYAGVMGVPITFLDKYCPGQFEVMGISEQVGTGFSNGLRVEGTKRAALINGKKKYCRLFIRNRNPMTEEEE